MDVLPEHVRLVDSPGVLRGVELRVLGWRTEEGETALICRLLDGSTGTVPARWTDLPLRVAAETPLGVVATPAGWRLLGQRLSGLRERRRPSRGGVSVENGGGDVRAARAAGERGGTGGAGGGVGDVAARAPDRGDAAARAVARRARGGGAR